MSSDSNFVGHEPCPACGSKDNLARYDDGHGYCMGCGHYEKGDSDGRRDDTRGDGGRDVHRSDHRAARMTNFIRGECQDLIKRKLRKETCEKFGYRVGKDANGKVVQVADYRDENGQLVAQKVRYPNKDFFVLGDLKAAGLYGQHLWKKGGGKRIVVTEGEIDCLSVAQAMNLSWPVVSVPNGAQGAKKALQNSLEFLESYDQIVLMFDNDEPGRKAAAECAMLFTPGKCAVAELPLKDPNDMLVSNRVKELTTAVWEAQVKRPDGIVNGADLWDHMNRKMEPGIPYPWSGLTAKTYGQHMGRLITWTSGSGMGKSEIVAQIAHDLGMNHGKKIGYIGLEENVGRSAQRFVGYQLGKLIHLPNHGVSQEELRKAFDATLGTGRFTFFDHFGSLEEDDLMSRIRFMIKGLGCEVIILDHLSIVISGLDDGDERKTIDRIMTRLRSIVEETGCMMHLISHLKRPEGSKGHEEGARVSLAHLRGSHSIAQLSDYVIAAERDQQHPDELVRSTTIIRVIKNRVSGDTGIATCLRYNKQTGELQEVAFVLNDDGTVTFDPSDAGEEFASESDDDIPF